jgi:hypothetical protein
MATMLVPSDPLTALAARASAAFTGDMYGALVDRDGLWLPEGFEHRVAEREPAAAAALRGFVYGAHDGSRLCRSTPRGTLAALRVRGEPRANMDAGRVITTAHRVDWVAVDAPGAARFDRIASTWVAGDRVHVACPAGGLHDLGQVFAYDPARGTIALMYEASDATWLTHPRGGAVVPATGDLLLCGDDVRGISPDGDVYPFAAGAGAFRSAAFSPDGSTLFLGQGGVTHAVTGPW